MNGQHDLLCYTENCVFPSVNMTPYVMESVVVVYEACLYHFPVAHEIPRGSYYAYQFIWGFASQPLLWNLLYLLIVLSSYLPIRLTGMTITL